MQGAGYRWAGCPLGCQHPGHPEAFERADGGTVVPDRLQDSHGDVADMPPVVAVAELDEPADGVAEYGLAEWDAPGSGQDTDGGRVWLSGRTGA